MLANKRAQTIGPEVLYVGIFGYERSMLRAMKNTFAGRSPSRRMK